VDGASRRALPARQVGQDDADAAATIALTALTLAAVVSLGRLFSSGGWVGPVVLTVLGMHAVAWLCRRQRWSAVTSAVVMAGALLLLVSWLVLPGSTRFGLPLTGTWRAAGQALNAARNEFHAVTAPAPATQGFVLITAFAIGVLVVLADWAAFRGRATIEATVPSLTLFVFASYLGGPRHRTQNIAIELAAVVAFVVVHQATVSRDRSTWFANRTEGALASAAKTGAVIGLVALVVCLNLSFRLPGAGSRAVLKLRAADRLGSGGTREAPNPLVDLQSHLLDHGGGDVFTVRSSTPAYWRLTSLDTYAGTEWMSNDSYSPVHRTLPKSGATTPGAQVDQQFTILNLESPWLPAAYQPESISGPSGISYDPQSGSLITSKTTSTGLQYDVTSVLNVGQLTPSLLESAPPVGGESSLDRYEKLPKIPAGVVNLARSITAGKTTEYDKALALQNYLRSPANFTYDETFDSKGDGPDALEYFLFTSKRGYCQQFAGSFAVMARLVGLPTRLALGWTYGTDENGVWHVSDDDYHTWPEVYFPQVGWVPFEPTPGRGMPGAQGYTNVAAAEQGSTPDSSASTATTAPPDTSSASPGKAPGDNGAASSTSSSGGGRSRHSLASLALTVGILGVSAMLLAGLWVLGVAGARKWRLARRRQTALGGGPQERPPPPRAGVRGLLARMAGRLPARSRPTPDPDESIVACAEVLLAWAETSELLAWWRTARLPAETYLEFARRAARQLRVPLGFDRDALASLSLLAATATKAEYGATLSMSEAETAVEAAASVGRALRGSATAWQRCRLALDPRLTIGSSHS
jgi:transglutaminase-like putative cysteine protease